MPQRTALIVSCPQHEADTTREQAALQRRTMSGYMLHILMRNVVNDEQFLATHKRLASWHGRNAVSSESPRTTMLIRCSTEEATRIRAAAKHRDTTVSGYVLYTLRSSWEAAQSFPLQPVRSTKDEAQPGDFVRAVLPRGGVVTGRVNSILRETGATKFELTVAGQGSQLVYRWQIVKIL